MLTATPTLVRLILASALVVAVQDADLKLVYEDDFEQGAARWKPTDPQAWKVVETDKGRAYSQFVKNSRYQPPHRSPVNLSLLEGVHVADFVLDVDVRSTHPDYGHRDVCLCFGYQDPAHFYYVHLGKQTDDHANQIFVVNDAPRTKISTKTTAGTNWDDRWHHVRIVRRAKDGTIQVFFDDLEQPVMEARDTTFSWGQVGLGSFDDTSDWDNFVLRGVAVPRPETR